MLIADLSEATLIKRYKRFLADVRLADGSVVTCHCPNPGSMLGLAEPGMKVYLSFSDDPKRKLPWSWKVVVCPESFVVIDTMLANKLVHEAFLAGKLSEFASYNAIKPEQTFGDSRFDFMLTDLKPESDCAYADAYLEVKSTTLIDANKRRALFPDAKTERGRKHLETLMAVKASGLRAVQFYLVGRSDATSFSSADHIDPAYGAALRRAREAGVEIFCRQVNFERAEGQSPEKFDLHVTVGSAVSIALG